MSSTQHPHMNPKKKIVESVLKGGFGNPEFDMHLEIPVPPNNILAPNGQE